MPGCGATEERGSRVISLAVSVNGPAHFLALY